MITKKDRKKIKDFYGPHVRIKITRDDQIHVYGHHDPFNRQYDYWRYAGTVDEVLADLERELLIK